MSNYELQKPSFTLFYWKPWQENSNFFNSWLEYNKDLSLINYAADSVGKYLSKTSEEQIIAIGELGDKIGLSITDSTSSINNSIEKGVLCISSNLESIQNELSVLNGNMELAIEQQRITNLLLEDIFEVLRLPEREKERNHHIELGLKFFSNAKLNDELLDDALDSFSKAEALMPQDYFVLHRIGMIYAYSNKHMDLNKAISYFKKAAKYASVESSETAIFLTNILRSSSNSELKEIENQKDAIGYLAADSFEKAAFCSYILGNFDDAVNFQNNAVKYNKTPTHYFLLSKYECRANKIDQAKISLSRCFDLNPEYIAATLKDLDLTSKNEISELIIQKDIEFKNKILSIQNILKHKDGELFNNEYDKLSILLSQSAVDRGRFLQEYESKIINVKNSIKEIKSKYKNIEKYLNKKDEYSMNAQYVIDKSFIIEDLNFEKLIYEFDNDDNDLWTLEGMASDIIKIFDSELNKYKASLSILNLDTLFEDAARIVVEQGIGSTSLIQRRMNLGYNRAGKLMSELEMTGIVGPYFESKTRELYINKIEHLEWLLSQCSIWNGKDKLWVPTKKVYKRKDPINDSNAINKSIKRNEEKVVQIQKQLNTEPKINTVPANESKSPCFIVTAVMGNPTHPVVEDFRNYRDKVLSGNFFGRGLIRCYYFIGPIAASVIKRNAILFSISKTVIAYLHKKIINK